MKTIISALLLCTAVYCELPPPLPREGFRPNPQFLSESSKSRSIDVKIPSRLTIEQLIKLTEQLHSDSSYLPPQREPQQTYVPQSQLRPPSVGFSQPQTFRPINRPQNQYGYPQVSQGIPNKFQNPPASTSCGVPQSTYGVPNRAPPSTSYGIPDNRNVETFEKQQNEAAILRQNILNNLRNQDLPYYKSVPSFRPQEQQTVSKQYLPAVGGGSKFSQETGGDDGNSNFGSGINKPNGGVGNYLPPQTTPKNPSGSRVTTPAPTRTTPVNIDGAVNPDYDYDLQPTTPSNQDSSEAGGPNVAISNAVAGPGGFFYLQQPDGRLQRVVLQKTKEPNSKPEEYVANYYFQNVHALPGTVYTPLVTLGPLTQK